MESLIARNPDAESRLPYLLAGAPLGAGLVLRARDTWPRTTAVYLHPVLPQEWPGTPGDRRTGRSDDRRRGPVSQVFTLTQVRPAVVADGLAELQVRWPNVPIVFCETRKLAEEWVTGTWPQHTFGMTKSQPDRQTTRTPTRKRHLHRTRH